jgi:hypothetical protein
MAGEEWSAVVEWRWLREQVNGLHWLERLMTLELPGTARFDSPGAPGLTGQKSMLLRSFG